MQQFHDTEQLTLASVADVEMMITTNKPRLLPVTADIRITLPGFTPDEAIRWETRLASQRNGCGCGMGMAFMLVGVIGYIAITVIAALVSHSALNAWFFIGHILVALLVMFVAAGVGKVVGLALAQYRFKRLSTKLLQVIKQKKGNG